ISIHQYLSGHPLNERPKPGMNLVSQKMGIHEWSYDNAYSDIDRLKVPHVGMEKRFDELNVEVELGFDEKKALTEAARCLNCDVQTVFSDKLCIECDACVDICPTQCLTITPNKETPELIASLSVQPQNFPAQALLI